MHAACTTPIPAIKRLRQSTISQGRIIRCQMGVYRERPKVSRRSEAAGVHAVIGGENGEVQCSRYLKITRKYLVELSTWYIPTPGPPSPRLV